MLELRKIDKFDVRINELWRKVKSKYPVTINRTEKYLNHRYAEHPSLKYDMYICVGFGYVRGFVVTRIEEAKEQGIRYRIGRIIDFIADDMVEEFMLKSIIGIMETDKVDLIDFFFSGNFHVDALKSHGFEQSRDGIPIVFNPIDRTRKLVNLMVYSKYDIGVDKIYVTRGDGDADRPN